MNLPKQEKKSEFIIMGSSVAQYGWRSPSCNQSNIGNCWNLGTGGGNAQALLNRVLQLENESNNFENVIFVLNPRMFNASSKYLIDVTGNIMSSPIGRKAKLYELGVPLSFLNLFLMPTYGSIFRTLLFPHTNSKREIEQIENILTKEINGWYPEKSTSNITDLSGAIIERIHNFKVDNTSIQYLAKSIQLLRSWNKSVYLVEAPVHPLIQDYLGTRVKNSPYKKYLYTLQRISSMTKAQVLFVKNQEYYQARFFYDEVHLNEIGAEAWTNSLIDQLH